MLFAFDLIVCSTNDDKKMDTDVGSSISNTIDYHGSVSSSVRKGNNVAIDGEREQSEDNYKLCLTTNVLG